MTWVDEVAARVLAGFAADPELGSERADRLALVAYDWAFALDAERLKRAALSQPAATGEGV
jgi:hypothetical protein